MKKLSVSARLKYEQISSNILLSNLIINCITKPSEHLSGLIFTHALSSYIESECGKLYCEPEVATELFRLMHDRPDLKLTMQALMEDTSTSPYPIAKIGFRIEL